MLFRSQAESLTVTPITQQRATTKIEELRTKVESAKVRPSLFMANYGSLAELKPRADFVKGFFEVGAFKVLCDNFFTDVNKMVEAALKSNSKFVCICATDDAYQELVPQFVADLKAKNNDLTIVLAGYPKEHIETFKEAGVEEFIHLKADCYTVLNNLLSKVGV